MSMSLMVCQKGWHCVNETATTSRVYSLVADVVMAVVTDRFKQLPRMEQSFNDPNTTVAKSVSGDALFRLMYMAIPKRVVT
jgi:hypothetical protein